AICWNKGFLNNRSFHPLPGKFWASIGSVHNDLTVRHAVPERELAVPSFEFVETEKHRLWAHRVLCREEVQGLDRFRQPRARRTNHLFRHQYFRRTRVTQ